MACRPRPGDAGRSPAQWSTAAAAEVYTSWVFGHRLRAAGLLGSMGRVAFSVDNTMIESFWSTMKRELPTPGAEHQQQLASAIFEWIEARYNPCRRHTSHADLSPIEFENVHTAAIEAA